MLKRCEFSIRLLREYIVKQMIDVITRGWTTLIYINKQNTLHEWTQRNNTRIMQKKYYKNFQQY